MADKKGRRTVALLVGLAVVASLVGVGATPAGAVTGDVAFDGESGTITGATTVVDASVTAGAAKNGTGGLLLDAAAERSFVRWGTDVVPQGHTHASFRTWVRVISRGTNESVDLLTIGNAQQLRNFDFFVNGVNQRFQWDLFSGDTDSSSFVVEYGRWYLVEAQVEFAGTEHSAEVRIDGVLQGEITSDYVATTVRQLTVGADLVKTHTQHYDDLALRVGDAPFGWLANTPPTITIGTPLASAVYDRGQVVAADFGCTGVDFAVATCSGTVADGVALDTSTLGAHTFTVNTTDTAGNAGTASRSYTVVDGTDPTSQISTPGANASYVRGSVVAADYACADEAGGSGLAPSNGCVGTVADGAAIATGTLGPRSFSVTARDAAGNTATVTRSYTVVDGTDPTVQITSPSAGATLARNQVVVADYACSDEAGGSGLSPANGCTGTVADGSPIDTSTGGVHDFSVTAVDAAGNSSTVTRTYTVTDQDAPTVAVMAPLDGAIVARGAVVAADYACQDDAGGSGLAPVDGCVGTVGYGSPIDTSGVGQHSFTVTATDAAGNTSSEVRTYTVVPNRPDNVIRPRTSARFTGDDVYTRSGARQSREARIRGRHAATFLIRIENDGPATDTFRIRGTKADRRWRVSYFHGTRNVSAAVRSGVYRISDLPPGAAVVIGVVVRPTHRADRGDRKTVSITSQALHHDVRDTVRAVTRLR